MNILLIIPETKGTIANVSHNLFVSLKEMTNHNIIVAELSGKKTEGLLFDNIQRISFDDKLFVRCLKNYYRVVFLNKLKKQFDIDLSISTLLGCNICNAFSKRNDTTIAIFHTRLRQIRRLGFMYYLIHTFLLRLAIKKIDRVIAVNKTAQIDMMKFSHRDDVELIYNIHLFDKIKAASIEDLDNETETGLFLKPVILFVGHLFNVKAPDRLIRAFSIVKNSFPEAQMVFIGANTEHFKEKVLDKIVEDNLLDNSVHYLGVKSNPYKYMARSKLLVSPSRDEGLPGVIIEALSLKIPVVSTNSSLGVWEIMGCEDQYQKGLSSLFFTDCGVITPNTSDENYNVEKLSEGISEVLNGNVQFNSFDSAKFSKCSIIQKLLVRDVI